MRAAVLVLAIALCAASASPGERAAGDDCQFGWCPDADPNAPDAAPPCPVGEMCSDSTPNGLWFAAVVPFPDQIFGSGPNPTATGGLQTIRVLTGPSLSSAPFDLPFEAYSSDEGVVAIDSTSPPNVRVRGIGPGTAHLRVVEPGTGLLYDRIVLTVATITRTDLKPWDALLYADRTLWEDPGGWALLAGGYQDGLGLQLFAGDTRVADEAVDVADATPTLATATLLGTYGIALEGIASGQAALTVIGGDGVTYPLRFRVAGAVGGVACVESPFVLPCTRSVWIGGRSLRCFKATSQTAVLYGATWSFAASSQLALAPVPTAPPWCIEIEGVTEGVAALTATANGVSSSFLIEVTPAMAAPEPSPRTPPPEARAGERTR